RPPGYASILEGEITQTGVGFVYKKKIQRLSDIFHMFRRSRRPDNGQPTPAQQGVPVISPGQNTPAPAPEIPSSGKERSATLTGKNNHDEKAD
ncbi:MAG: hypothetical protein K2H14_06300, partial [Muribaculaceae bacterium]|nr:hypothetical protein [Muribaculaceae bacterium]